MSFKLPAFFDSRVKKAESKNSKNNRVRSKEHVPGNWPTIIFIPINLCEEDLKLVKEIVSSSFDTKFEPVDPITPQSSYHMSLSRTLYLKDHQKELFHRKIVAVLKKILMEFPLPETIETEKFSVYLNDEKTRTFVAIDLGGKSEIILKYIEGIDSVLKEFGLPVYYSSPKFHFSMVWCQGDRFSDLIFDAEKEKINLKVELKQILIKCGNKVSTIN